MQWLKRRWVLFGVVGALACAGDPTGNESTPTAITADPDVVFVTQSDSEAVIVSVVDEDGQILQADFTPSNVDQSVINVVADPAFQQVTTGEPIRRQSRFFVKGVQLAHTTFTLSALGLNKDIEVFSVPGELNAEITDTLPDIGETVTITAPPGTFFSDSSVLSFTGLPPLVVAQDETTISFLAYPGIDGPAVVSNVGVASNPDVVFELATPYRVLTPGVTEFPSTVNDAAPDVNEAVTITSSDALFGIADTAQAQVGAVAAAVTGRTANSITFIPAPGATGPVTINGVVVAGVGFALPSTAGDVTVSSTITPLTGTDDPGTAPTINVPDIGLSNILYDAGTYDVVVFGCCGTRLYKLTVPSDRTITLTLDWPSGEDLGAYLFDANGFVVDGDTFTGFVADAAGEGGHPEVTSAVVPAGTYILGILNFSATDPPQFSIRLDSSELP